jgi:hypothetical protein
MIVSTHSRAYILVNVDLAVKFRRYRLPSHQVIACKLKTNIYAQMSSVIIVYIFKMPQISKAGDNVLHSTDTLFQLHSSSTLTAWNTPYISRAIHLPELEGPAIIEVIFLATIRCTTVRKYVSCIMLRVSTRLGLPKRW